MRSPFKFLDAYTVQDKNVFFGRDSEIESLYNLVFKTNLLIVYGLSGTGKTSVIQCGLASRFDGPDWYPMFIRRNENLNDSIQLAMKAVLKDETKDSLTENVSYLIRKTLRPVYLIFDQFEELFVLGSQKEQVTFIQSLRTLLDSGVNAKVLLVMREEYIGQLYPFEQALPHLFDFRFRVEPMGIAKVKSVIRDSFDKFNIHLEKPVDDSLQLMVEQITDPKAGIALPYLQVYLDMLYRVTYRKKYGNDSTEEPLPPLEITRADIATLGRIGNVLEKFLMQQTAELNTLLRSEYPGFPHNGIELILDPFATDDGTKRPLHYNRNGDQIELDASVQAVLPKLPEGSLTRAIELMDVARILRVREDTMELAHDSLAAVVDRKRTDEQRQLQEIRRRLTNGYDEFQKTGVFLNAKQLASFEEYLPKLQLTDELTSFIKQSEEATKKEAEAERMREQQEQQSRHHKKLARVRGVLLTLVAIFAGGAVLFAMRSTKNYRDASEKGEKLANTLDTIQMQQDSIENILIQVNQQLGRMDSVVDGHFKEQYKIEIQKSVITLKSLVSNDTISDEEVLRNHASGLEFLTTTQVNADGSYGREERKFAMGQDVYAYGRIDPRKPVELLQLKWMGPDQKIVGSPVYQEVDSTKRHFIASTKFEQPGRYQARLYNSAGKEIGQTNFVISERPKSELSVSEFRIVESVSGGKPGRETSRFASGKTVYFWGRVICPLSKSSVVVEIMYPSGKKDQIRYDIALNTNPGYMVWDGKGFGETGRYVIRVLDDRGNELFESGFEIY